MKSFPDDCLFRFKAKYEFDQIEENTIFKLVFDTTLLTEDNYETTQSAESDISLSDDECIHPC